MRGPTLGGLAVISLIAACGRVGFDASRDGGAAGGDGGRDGPSTLTVTIEGSGAVISDPAGIACIDQCSAQLGGAVTLTAYLAGSNSIAAWIGTSCGATPTCTVDVTGDTAVTAQFTGPLPTDLNLVFTTTAVYDGSMRSDTQTGAAAADTICATTATANGLPGTFTAFVSTTAGRNATDALAGSTGWLRTDGVQMFQQVSDITAYGQLAAFDRDEHGALLADASGDVGMVWMGGDNRGQSMGTFDCTGFSSNSAAVNGYEWYEDQLPSSTSSIANLCSANAHLVCISHGETGTLTPFPLGRYVFETTAAWHGPGIASADALCATEAAGLGLAGTFVAAVATSTQSIADHIGGKGGPWRTPQGVLLTFADLDADLRAPIGTTNGSAMAAWVGGFDLDSVADPADDCTEWTFAAGGQGATSLITYDGDAILSTGTVACTAPDQGVICAQLPGS